MRFIYLVLFTSFSNFLVAQEAFTFFDQVIDPGTKKEVIIPINDRRDSTYIPVTVLHGARKGPVLGITAGVHGYEYPPILAAQKIVSKNIARRIANVNWYEFSPYGFHESCIVKFDEQNQWDRVNENSTELYGTSIPKNLNVKWTQTLYDYERWFQVPKNFENHMIELVQRF